MKKITSELDSAYQVTPKKTYFFLPFYDIHLKSYFLKMASGSHLGFMQIKWVAQTCPFGNQAIFTLEHQNSAKKQKNFIVLNISRLCMGHIEVSNGLFVITTHTHKSFILIIGF